MNEGKGVEPLAAQHDRARFSCGQEALDRYLATQAGQDVRRRVARVFVGVSPGAPETVAGFYTLSAASLSREELPSAIARKLPHYPVPAALLGRLAVDIAQQGHGWGEFLLVDALRRVMTASTSLAMHAVMVDAKNETAETFYKRYGFQSFYERPTRLFLTLDSIVKRGL